MTRWLELVRATSDDLRAAGPKELFWRAWAGAANGFGLRRRRFEPPTENAFLAALPDSVGEPGALHAWLRQRPSCFLFDPGDRARYRPLLGRFPSSRNRADFLLEDAVLLFGRPATLSDSWD